MMYELTFHGGCHKHQRYKRDHDTVASAKEEAQRVLAEMDDYGWPRAAHPATIDGPGLGPDGITLR